MPSIKNVGVPPFTFILWACNLGTEEQKLFFKQKSVKHSQVIDHACPGFTVRLCVLIYNLIYMQVDSCSQNCLLRHELETN